MHTTNQHKTSLGHLRVLDLTRVLAGPWCTQNLADLGAEVIKVERPDQGDDTRSWGPPYLKNQDGNETSEAAYYLAANRGKQAIAIDIATPEGQALIIELVKHSDVLIENFKCGQLKKYGLDYATLSKLKPDLIYCSITGFGQDGPYANRAGYDFIIQGMGGLMSLTGERDGMPGGGPQKAGIAITDLMTGMYATVAILAALTHRDRTGEGQYIDLALLDVQVAMLANMGSNYLTSQSSPQRWGNAHPNIVPYQTFPTADGHIIIAAGNDMQYKKFVTIGERHDLANDPRFATNPLRVQHREILVPLLEVMCKTKTKQAWISALEAAGVPCGPINNLDEVFRDPQVIAREMQIQLDHPIAGSVPLVASPLRLSKTPVQYHQAPPTLGQHTQACLRNILNLSDEEIHALQTKRII
ncbi:CaiB/BaiF CoA transferase family protein [Undibacterium fentianense]|uniref:CoA transferase n=1 Tax=Undibacterium fentianense TaxID=2828728 RepID=A0A941DXL0_9BURK|nr:CaiB/BaiF CoA-transferase family protein [Undibacterium fentianense]MBR7799299.1 CoA transferase [Undibacterium fentianense]